MMVASYTNFVLPCGTIFTQFLLFFFAFLGGGERGGKASTNPCFSSQAAL